jgi:hypothetical protein
MQNVAHAVKRTGRRWLGGWLALALGLAAVAAAAEAPSVSSPDEVAAIALPSPVGALTYTPGRGLHLGDTHLTLGGYSNVNLTRDEGGPANLALDDLSLFVTWDPLPRIHLFSELEFEDLVEVDDHGNGGTNAWDFIAERLYGDFTLTDQVGFRVGKFLTPVGRWNVIHAQPLVWTTSRPLATLLPFDPHTTGAMLYGSAPAPAGGLGYSLYGQFTDQLDPSVEPQLAQRSGGARLEYTAWPGWSVGASYLAFLARQRRGLPIDRWEHLAGLDALYRRGPLEVMGEFAWERDQWGLYLQASLEVLPHIFAVGRYEYFDQPAPFPAVHIGVAGIDWAPRPYLLFKSEYLFSDHRAEESPPGFKSSVAVLF